jgi:hypothetical protein
LGGLNLVKTSQNVNFSPKRAKIWLHILFDFVIAAND